MKRMRKFIGFAAIAAVLNPLCCCFADAVAAAMPADEQTHACCAQQKDATASEKAPSGGCSSDEGCPHEQGAYQREMPVVQHTLVAAPAAPVALPAQVFALEAAPEIHPTWERGEQRPPGRHDPPAYLRSHSFLN